MSEFFKKNMPLVVVLGVTALAAIVLIALVVGQYQAINEKMQNIDKTNEQINAITSQTNPRVVKKNAELIKQDAAALEQKTREQQRVFGCYLDQALNTFIETLRKEAVSDEFKAAVKDVTPNSLRSLLSDKIKDQGENFNALNPRIDDLTKLYAEVEGAILETAGEKDKAAYQKAFAAFCAEAAKTTLENLTNEKDEFAASKAVFLQAIGLPRSFKDGFALAEYFSKYANDVVDGKKIPFVNMKADNDEGKVRNYFTEHEGFANEESSLDHIAPVNIPYAMTRIQIYENLILNMKKSGVQLISLYRQGKFAPESDANGYDTYSTTVKIYGTLKQIREFSNYLHKEYQNNRVYLVTYLSLSSDDPDAEGKSANSKYSKEITNAKGYVDLVAKTANAKATEGEENSKKAEQDRKTINDNWGAALIGVNDKAYAIMHINYIVFTGDQVTNAKK